MENIGILFAVIWIVILTIIVVTKTRKYDKLKKNLDENLPDVLFGLSKHIYKILCTCECSDCERRINIQCLDYLSQHGVDINKKLGFDLVKKSEIENALHHLVNNHKFRILEEKEKEK